jgi:pimeloyl-ACP methyl ester carboxylesterase
MMILAAAAAALMTPTPVPAPVSSEITAPGPSGALAGTYVRPAEAGAPVVLMIPGSGPTDRDGNSPAGVTAAPFRLLAEALAERGIASVRVDKRGMFGSAAAGDPNAVRVRDYVSDIRSWVRTIRATAGSDCVWVMGHSEGVLMALAAAAEDDEGICGLILVAGAGRRLSDVLREQFRASPQIAPHLTQALAALDRLESGERVDPASLDPALMPLFHGPVQDYLIDNFAHDPALLAARVNVPMLVVQGLADIQTTEADARRIAEANDAARLVLLPGVNHVLKNVEGNDRQANIATYGNSSLPLGTGVAEAIADFVAQQR